MSDDFIRFVPRDPNHVPSSEAQRRATELVRALLPNAHEVKSEQSARIQFFDCGSNFERVSCPHCHAELSLDWWREAMGEGDGGGGFDLAPLKLPCCRHTSDLNELLYDWPQAFGRFAVTVLNPGVVEVPASLLAAIEASLDCAVITVRQHL